MKIEAIDSRGNPNERWYKITEIEGTNKLVYMAFREYTYKELDLKKIRKEIENARKLKLFPFD